MTADTRNAEVVAKGLTEAQRLAVLSLPVGVQFLPRDHSRQLATMAVLRAKRLIRTVGDPDTEGPWSENIITGLGLSVRRILSATGRG